jgi:hypothetical protein
VWAGLSDQQLQETLRDYLWLVKTPSNAPHKDRIEQLVSEAKRRGKPEVLEKARRMALDTSRRFKHPW